MCGHLTLPSPLSVQPDGSQNPKADRLRKQVKHIQTQPGQDKAGGNRPIKAELANQPGKEEKHRQGRRNKKQGIGHMIGNFDLRRTFIIHENHQKSGQGQSWSYCRIYHCVWRFPRSRQLSTR